MSDGAVLTPVEKPAAGYCCSKPPAFLFYARDFATGTATLSAEEVGVYIRLLCQQWDKGTLPADHDRLARIAGVPAARMRRLWLHLQVFFAPDPQRTDGIINARLEFERQKQADFRRRQSDNGKRGGRPGKPEGPKPNPSLSSGLTQVEATPSLKESSALCSLHSAEREKEPPVSPVTNEALADRAREFIEFYAGLYPTLRLGVPYRRKDALEFPTACSLVATWPNDRLELMAEIFLRTDHKFAAEGNRTINQFAALAEWCDGRLRENGR